MPQSPTVTNVWVRSVRDAMLIFNAVANGVAPKVDRRLDENERRFVRAARASR
jgi:phage-related protein